MTNPKDWEPVPEAIVRMVAKIVGPNSAATKALEYAEQIRAKGEKVSFYTSGDSFVVVGEPPE